MFCFAQFCLICLDNAKNLVNLDVHVALCDENITLRQILMEIKGDLLNFDEIFPKYICNSCKKDLITTYKFHKRCCKSIDNLTNYINKLNNLHLPLHNNNNNNNNNNSNKTKKTYSFGYNEITSRHMLFKIKKLSKHNFKARKSNKQSISVRSNLSSIGSVRSKSISDQSTIILDKTEHFNLKSTIDKLAKYLNITDLDKLDHNILEQHSLDSTILDQSNLELSSLDIDDNNASNDVINQKSIETTSQNLNNNDLINLDQEFYDVFNITDDYFVKEENALDLGSCDLSDISLSSKIVDIKNEIKCEQIKCEHSTNLDVGSIKNRSKIDLPGGSSKNNTYIDLTNLPENSQTSNNNYIDLTASPKKSNLSNSPVRSKNCVDLTVSPTKGSKTCDVGETINYSQNHETNFDFTLTGSNYSIIDTEPNDVGNIFEFDHLDHPNSVLDTSNASSSIELDIKHELVNVLNQKDLDQTCDDLNISIQSDVSQEFFQNKNAEPCILEPCTSVLDRSNSDLNNSLELEIKQELTDHYIVQHNTSPNFNLDDLNLRGCSNNSELDIEEHPVEYNSVEMKGIKIEIEEILKEHAGIETNISKNNSAKRKLDVSEPKKARKRSKRFLSTKKVPDLASFSSKIIANAQIVLSGVNVHSKRLQEPNDPLLEPNDPNLTKCTKNIDTVHDLASFTSKITENVQLVLRNNEKDVEKVKEPNDPNPEIKELKALTPTLLCANINDPNLEPSIAPNDPNINLQKSINIEERNISQETKVPNVIVPKFTSSPISKILEDPNNSGKDPTISPPNIKEPKSGCVEVPDKKVLVKIKFCKKPINLNLKDPNVQELQLFDLNDSDVSKETTIQKMCHKKESSNKLDLFKNVAPNDPHKINFDLKDPVSPSAKDKERNTISIMGSRLNSKDPNDPKTKDCNQNEKLKPNDNKCLSPIKIDLKELKDPNDPKILNLDSNVSKTKKIDLSPKKRDVKESSSIGNNNIDPKNKNLEPNDPQIKNMNSNMQETKSVNDSTYVSPKKIDLEPKPNDPKVLNLVPNDPRIKKYNIIVPEINCNRSKIFSHVISNLKDVEHPNDPKELSLDPIDPKSQNLISKELQSNDLSSDIIETQQLSPEKVDAVILSHEDPNDPKSGSAVADRNQNISKDLKLDTIPEKLDTNDAISKQAPKNNIEGPNPSTSNENTLFTPHTCRYCTEAYETGFQLKSHIFDAHKSNFNECTTCKMTFSTRFKLFRHIEMYHTDASNVFRNDIPDLREIDCRRFPNQDNRYIRYGPLPFRNLRSVSFRNDNFRTRNVVPLICDICCKPFFSAFNLNKHYYLVHR